MITQTFKHLASLLKEVAPVQRKRETQQVPAPVITIKMPDRLNWEEFHDLRLEATGTLEIELRTDCPLEAENVVSQTALEKHEAMADRITQILDTAEAHDTDGNLIAWHFTPVTDKPQQIEDSICTTTLIYEARFAKLTRIPRLRKITKPPLDQSYQS